MNREEVRCAPAKHGFYIGSDDHSRSDFIAKLQIALKECSESEYRLELLIESGHYSDTTVFEHCVEMKKLLISSLNTAKKNTKQRHPYCCDVPRRRGRHIVRGGDFSYRIIAASRSFFRGSFQTRTR